MVVLGFIKCIFNLSQSHIRGKIKIFHIKTNQRKAEVAILISDKKDFKTRNITKDKEGHFIMITGTIHQEDISLYSFKIQKEKMNRTERQTLKIHNYY